MRKIVTILLIMSFAGAAYVAADRPAMRFLVGMIGTGATVPPNPYNTLAEQLADKEQVLQTRERQLNERQAVVREGTQNLNNLLAIAVLMVAGLLGLNFYLDWSRRPLVRSEQAGERESHP